MLEKFCGRWPRSLFSRDSELVGQWTKNRSDEPVILAALENHANQHEAVRKCLINAHDNKARLNYKAFRQTGLCVSSGVVEVGCNSVIGARLKQSVMRWSVKGANAIIALRYHVESNRFDDFWEHRAEKN